MRTTTTSIRIRLSPNMRTADVRAGKLHLEVFDTGGVRRLLPDNSATGYYGTHWTDVPCGTFGDMAMAAVEKWKTDRAAWQECE